MTTARPTPRSIAGAVRAFRWLTALMPRAYRLRHRDEAVDLLERLVRDAHDARGVIGVVDVSIRAIADLILDLPGAYVTRRRIERQNDLDDGRSARDRMRAAADALMRDVRYALRSIRRRPLSSAAAIGTLAIGVGLNAAVFSVVDWVLLRPLPYPSARELVRVFSGAGAARSAPLTFSEFERFSRARSFAASTAMSTATRVVGGSGVEPAHVIIARVTGDLFGTFEVRPALGRAFDERDITSGAPVVVVSHAFWRTRLSADPAVVGRILAIDGRPHSILGVMPTGLGYPRDADLWRPMTGDEREDDDRENVMIGRLAAGSTIDRAALELQTLAAGLSPNRTFSAEDVQRAEVRDVRATLIALFASSALILLMSCANLTALLRAQGVDRLGEMAVRGALGATRGRLLQQLLTESVIVAAASGVLGLVLGRWTLDVLIAIAPGGLPRLTEISVDARVVIAGVAATLLVGVAAGFVSAYRSARHDLRVDLAGAGASTGAPRTGGRRLLVAAQTAMAVVVAISAGLLGRSLQHLAAIDHGFAPERLVAVDLYLRGGATKDVGRLFHDLIEAADEVPGVRGAAISMRLPTQVPGIRVQIRNESSAKSAATATLRPVTPRYFETAGIALTEGRDFGAGDVRTAPPVAIVNATFVRDVRAGRAAIGASVNTSIAKAPMSIVGIVADVTPGGEADRPALYVPLDQVPIGEGSLLIRTTAEAKTVVPSLAARLRTVAPSLALDRVREVSEILEAGSAVTRFSTRLASGFAVLALLLASIGVYGLTAGEVAGRWRELAVRLALGATRVDALWTVLKPGATATATGIACGIAASMWTGPLMRSLLYGVGPADPRTLVAVAALLALAGILAGVLGATRVLRADPAATLRGE